MIALAPDPIDPAALLADLTRSVPGAGAIVSFSGLVRPGGEISELWLDHHELLTLAALETVAHEARERFGIAALAIVHRIGSVGPGAPIVFVAAAAAHRRAAFDAVDYAMDRLKTDVPLWKRETRADGAHWVEARPEDHRDSARWEEQRG